MSSDIVRVAVVGLGLVAQVVYLPLLGRRRDLFEITAVCDLSRDLCDALGARVGVDVSRRFGSLDDVLEAGGIDAVLLLTSGSHGAPGLRVVDSGLPVLCEKPLCFTLAEADRLVDRPELQLGYMKVFDPALERAREVVSGRGRPRSVEVVVLHPTIPAQIAHLAEALIVPADPVTPPSDRPLLQAALGPAADRLGSLYANVLLGSVVHDLAVVRALVGDPSAIEHADAWGGEPGSVAFEGRIGADTRLSMRWHFLDGRAVYRESVALHYDDATVEVVFASPFQLHAPTLLTVTEHDGNAECSRRWTSPVDAFERQLESWHATVTAAAPVGVTAAEGRTDIRTCQRIAWLLAGAREIEIGGEAAGSWIK